MNFQELLDEHDIHYTPEHNGWLQHQCPHCGGGKDAPHKLYMGYHVASGASNCWQCGRHSAIDTLAKLTGLSFKALRSLYQRPTGYIGQEVKPTGTLALPPQVGPLLEAHVAYLQERHFKVRELKQLWRLKGTGISLRLPWRIVIPIELYGETVSWTSRAIVDDYGPRYISAEAHQERISHKDILYGEDYVRHAVIVCEGPTDVWRIGPGAVATFGTGWSFAQVNRLLKFPVRYICFDNEHDAQRRARQLRDTLAGFPGKTAIVTIDAPDPGSCKPKEVRKLRRLLE